MGREQSVETYLEINNETNRDFTISVSEIDSRDWYGDNRPDRNFHNVTIKRKSSVRNREDMNAWTASGPFEMTLRFSDESVDHFRIHQEHAIGLDAGFQHFEKSHQISYQKGEKKLIITVENTWEQSQNEKAEVVNEQGEREFGLKLFSSAISKFEEAQQLANEASTVLKIRENLKKAKVLGLNEEGLVLQQKKYYEEAIEKFDQALSMTSYGVSRDIVHANKTITLILFGQFLYEEAWKLENDQNEDKSAEVSAKFQKSKTIFKDLSETQRLNLVELKISGNQLYNRALDEEKRALTMFENVKKSQSGDFAQVKAKYNEALKMYESAAMNFGQGSDHDAKFLASAKLVRERISGIQTAIENINKEELAFKKSTLLECSPDTDTEL